MRRQPPTERLTKTFPRCSRFGWTLFRAVTKMSFVLYFQTGRKYLAEIKSGSRVDWPSSWVISFRFLCLAAYITTNERLRLFESKQIVFGGNCFGRERSDELEIASLSGKNDASFIRRHHFFDCFRIAMFSLFADCSRRFEFIVPWQ